jgi:hypothetical protein
MGKRSCIVLVGLLVSLGLEASAQQPKPGILNADDLERVVPRHISSAANLRPSNCATLPASAAPTVSSSWRVWSILLGYAAEVQAKYQGFLITEVKLNIEGSHLAPGQYGFGFSKDGKFYLMDVGANDVFRVAAQTDDQLARPVPLKMIEGQAGYRLYAGRRWVNLKPE